MPYVLTIRNDKYTADIVGADVPDELFALQDLLDLHGVASRSCYRPKHDLVGLVVDPIIRVMGERCRLFVYMTSNGVFGVHTGGYDSSDKLEHLVELDETAHFILKYIGEHPLFETDQSYRTLSKASQFAQYGHTSPTPFETSAVSLPFAHVRWRAATEEEE